MATIEEIQAEMARRARGTNQGGLTAEDIKAEMARRRSAAEQTTRNLGLTGRNLVQGAYGGVLGLPALAGDAYAGFSNLVNTAITNPAMAGIESVTGAQMPRANMYPPMPLTNVVTRNAASIADIVGLPRPETQGEMMYNRAGTAAIEAATLGGLGRMVAGATSAATRVNDIGRSLADAPIISPISAATGTTATEYARQQGASPTSQMVAGILGGAAVPVTSAMAQTVPNVLKTSLRGRDELGMQRNIAQSQEIGVPVSAGNVSTGGGARMLESALGNAPFARSRMNAQREAEGTAIQSNIEELTKKLAPQGSDVISAGQATTKGTENYILRARQLSGKLYDQVDVSIPKSTRMDLSNFTTALKELTTPTPGAARTTGQFVNPFLRDLSANIAKDLGIADLSRVASLKPSYEVVSALRTRIGQKLSDSSLISDVPRGELKKLYGSLMNDIETSLASNPKASADLRRANAFTRELHNKVDNFLDPVTSKKTPEEVFNALMQNTQEGGTRLREVFNSIPEGQRKIVSATVFDKMGKARPGQQGAEGTDFSVETFLTNWNKLSPVAKKQITRDFSPDMTRSLDNITQASERIRNVNRAMPNPSGTGITNSAFATLTALGSAALGGLTGNIGTAAAAGGVVIAGSAIPNVTARMMTNPRFVNWLAQQTKVPASAVAGQVTLLRAMNEKENDDLLQSDINKFLNSVQQ